MSTFSVTERASFKRCRRSWFYSSFNGRAIQPAFPNAALNIGSVWHRGCELWALDGMKQNGHPQTRMVKHVMDAFDTTEAELIASVDRPLTEQETFSMSDQRTLLENMAINYEAFHKSPLPDGFHMIQPEQTIVVDVPDSPHKLEGTLDALIQSDATGLVYVLERKTYGNRPTTDSLQFGDQYVAYLWILSKLGYPPGGVAYDGAWKRSAPPRGKVMDDLFLRFTITRNAAELDEFERFLPQELLDMELARMNPALRYYNRRWEGCWDCSYSELCHAESRGEPLPLLLEGFTERPKRDRATVWAE